MNFWNKFLSCLLGISSCLSIYCAFTLHSLEKDLSSKMLMMTDKISSVSVNTDGKLQKLDEQYSKLAEMKSENTVRTEVRYVEKEAASDPDIEIAREKPQVSVRVNGGETYKFDLLEDESSKFEKGKIDLIQSSAMKLDITADDYRKSKWEVTTALNADKDALFGLSYSLGHCVSANAFVGQGIKPYYGLTWQIGGYSRKEK